MHANRVAYAANGNRHIVDMNMHIYQYRKGRTPDDPAYTKVLVTAQAYGAMNTKILARASRSDIATDITLNGQFNV